MSRAALVVVLGAALLGSGGRALGHPANVAFAEITIGERAVDVRLSVNTFELDLLLSLDADLDARVESHEVDARRSDVAEYLRKTLVVTAAGAPLPLELRALELGRGADGKPLLVAALRFASDRPLGHVAVRCDVLAELGRDHTTLARIVSGGREEKFAFRDGATYAGARSRLAAMREMVALGIDHIFVGYDHIAFLVGLLLAGGTLLNVLAIVTAFTAAHMVTVSLAALRVVTLPEVLVEVAIALSIVWVAVENLLGWHVLRRWIIGFVFGLVHGFGLATVLTGLTLPRRGLLTSLLAFNLGVEVGQVLIVLLVVPLLWLLRSTRLYQPGRQAASVAILLLGLYWLFERLA